MFKAFMKEYYQNATLDFHFWSKAKYKIHVDLAKGEYQFLPDSENYNEKRFTMAYHQINDLLSEFFEKRSEVLIVVNKYMNQRKHNKDIVLHKIIKRFSNSSLIDGSRFYLSEDKLWVNQLVLQTEWKNVKQCFLIQALINEDFPDRRPRFSTSSSFYPDIYLLNVKTGVIFHVYDDRGCEIYFKDRRSLKNFEEQKNS